MIQKNAVRSALVLFALTGMLTACGANPGATPSAPAAQSADGSTILSQEVTQKASVKIASVTDAEGRAVAIESSAVLGQLSAIDRALVTKEAVQIEGSLGERMVVDLGDKNGSIVKFQGDSTLAGLTIMTGGFPASAAEASVVDGKIGSLMLVIEDGRALKVVLAFGEAKQDEAKQDEAKQDEAKQDEAKQDEAKQDEAKQDEPKQDEPKQDEPKQDEPKQDEPKQDEPKQDEPKQDEPKQDEPKQDEAKQDEPKQDEAKQDEPKRDEAKQDEPKQDEAKQDEAKQDEAKQDEAKQK